MYETSPEQELTILSVSKPKQPADVPQRLFAIPQAFNGYLAQAIAEAKTERR
jgi:hypothetical protein